MPNYKGHLIGGAVAFAIVICFIFNNNVNFITGLEWLCFTLLGSLFPDIDIKSKGQKIFYKVLFCVLIFLAFKKQLSAIALISLLSFIPLLVRHRGMCHQLWFVITVPFAVAVCCNLFFPHYYSIILWDAIFFTVGAISHLWLDVGFRRMVRIR